MAVSGRPLEFGESRQASGSSYGHPLAAPPALAIDMSSPDVSASDMFSDRRPRPQTMTGAASATPKRHRKSMLASWTRGSVDHGAGGDAGREGAYSGGLMTGGQHRTSSGMDVMNAGSRRGSFQQVKEYGDEGRAENGAVVQNAAVRPRASSGQAAGSSSEHVTSQGTSQQTSSGQRSAGWSRHEAP